MKIRFGIGMGRTETINEIGLHAKVAEDNGFEMATVVDEPFLARDAFTMLAVMAMNTKKILLGHGVVDPLTYFPTVLGNGAASLQELSAGRGFLGIGAGAPAGKFMEPLSFNQFRESVVFLKQFMSGGESEFRGQKIHSEWIKGPVPIYLGADGPRALELAGELADGVITMGGPPKLIKWKMDYVERAALKAGRDPSKIDVWVRSIVIVADSKEAAFREGAAFMPGSGAIYRYVKLKQRGYREDIDLILTELDKDQPGIIEDVMKNWELFEHYQFEKLDNPSSKVVTQRVMDFFNQTGTVDDVCEGIEKLAEAGVKCLATANYTIIDKIGMINRVGKEIIPRFQD
jgi:5,10-methylenetetrahydromethanopterin reductase